MSKQVNVTNEDNKVDEQLIIADLRGEILLNLLKNAFDEMIIRRRNIEEYGRKISVHESRSIPRKRTNRFVQVL